MSDDNGNDNGMTNEIVDWHNKQLAPGSDISEGEHLHSIETKGNLKRSEIFSFASSILSVVVGTIIVVAPHRMPCIPALNRNRLRRIVVTELQFDYAICCVQAKSCIVEKLRRELQWMRRVNFIASERKIPTGRQLYCLNTMRK